MIKHFHIQLLLNNCQNVIELITNYNLAVKPNSKIKQLSLYLEKIEHSGLLDEKPKANGLIKNKADTSSFDEMVVQIGKTVQCLNDEYAKLQLDLQKKTAILQNEQNQKNLLSGNIDDLPKEIQLKYYADLGKKLTKK